MAYNIYSNISAEYLLELINISDCIKYYGIDSLIKSAGVEEVLDNIDKSEIVSYLEDKGYKIEKDD